MFEVGDTIRIKTGLNHNKKYDNVYFVKKMAQYEGKEATIIDTLYEGGFHLDIDNGAFVWSEGMVDCLTQKTYRHWERNLNNAV